MFAHLLRPGNRALALCTITAVALSPRPGAAQAPDVPRDSADTAPIRLGDLYRQVERMNPRIAAARLLAIATQARASSAAKPPDPQLQFGWMNYTLPNFTPMPTLGMVQLQAMQMLPLGGKLALAGRAASAQAAASSERATEVTWDLRAQVATEFYDLYEADQSLSLSRETLRLLQDIEKTVESMYRVGEGRQADVLRAQVEIAKMAADTQRIQAMRESIQAKLNALLDRSVSARVSTPALPVFPDSVPERALLEALAVGDRPMIRAGVEDVRAADASERLAAKELWPDLQVGVQYARQGAGVGGGTAHMGSLMLGASLPMFARDRQLRMRAEATAMKQMAQADLASMRADARAKVAEACADLNRARNLARLYRNTVLPQARAALGSALSAYRVGGVDFMTLLDDQMTVNTYRRELSALQADEGKAWAELEMLTGHELLDSNVSATSVARGEK